MRFLVQRWPFPGRRPCRFTPRALSSALERPALAQVEGVVKGAVQIIARLTDRQRYEQRTGRDPLRWPHCRHEMGV
jgi:hypothetical protein